ncbi:hypothetical protein [Enterococcus casseliflavus]
MALSPNILQIILEKPDAWEYIFFIQILLEFLGEADELKKDLRYEIILEFPNPITEDGEIFEWISYKYNQILKLTNGLSNLVNVAFPEAIGDPGTRGDIDFLLYIAEKWKSIYCSIIKWELELISISVPENTQELVYSLRKISQSLIINIDDFKIKLFNSLEKIANHTPGEQTLIIDLVMEFTEPDFTEFNKELEILKQKLGIS